MEDKYILKDDFKLIPNNSKKVDLSKPTDTLDHKVKHKKISKLYNNFNLLKKINHSNNKICLTKPQDIVNIPKKTSSNENSSNLDNKCQNKPIFSFLGFKFNYSTYKLVYENPFTFIFIWTITIILPLYLDASDISLTKIIIEILAVLILIFSIKVSYIVHKEIDTSNVFARGTYYIAKIDLFCTIIFEIIFLCKDIFGWERK